MATILENGFCLCGTRADIVYVEQPGRWYCPTCLFNLLKNDGFLIVKPGDGDVRCEDCNTVVTGGNRALCGDCIDSVHDYCHDDCNNGCWECGDSPDYVLCDYHMSARDDEARSDYQTCEDCGEAADYTLCTKCFAEYTEQGKEAAVVTDEGVITFNDIEINWAT